MARLCLTPSIVCASQVGCPPRGSRTTNDEDTYVDAEEGEGERGMEI